MTPTISHRVAAPMPVPTPAPGTPAQREAVKQLAQAFQNDDLASARQAYVGIVAGAPDGATWNPDSAFATLGRALVAGDLPAAKQAAKEALTALRSVKTPPAPGPAVPETMGTAPAASGADGTCGTLLNVVV